MTKNTKDTPKNTQEDTKENVENQEQQEQHVEEVTIKDLQKELEDAQASAKESYDKLLRTQAEMENLRKRSVKDVESAHKFALEKFAKSLLEVVDSIAMGIKTAGEDATTLESITEGMTITQKIFLDVLEKNNITQINPQSGKDGDKFDPEQHEAITMVANPDLESGDILEVVQIGFALSDRVIRPAMVIVVS